MSHQTTLEELFGAIAGSGGAVTAARGVSKRSAGNTSLLGANVRKVVQDDARGVDSFLMRC
jgi:hypothetical protein